MGGERLSGRLVTERASPRVDHRAIGTNCSTCGRCRSGRGLRLGRARCLPPAGRGRTKHGADVGGDGFHILLGDGAQVVGHGLHGAGGDAVRRTKPLSR